MRGHATRRFAALLIAPVALLSCIPAASAAEGPVPAKGGEPPQPVEVSVSHGPQKPSSVPVLPGLFVGKQIFYGPLVGRPAEGQGYQPADGDSFAVQNGQGIHHFILTSGMWWLRVGDRPRLAMELRSGSGAYAQPGLLPDLGVSGQFRVAVTAGEKTKWLDKFGVIAAVLSPGSARWTCRDEELGVAIALSVRPLLEPWGFAVVADVTSLAPKNISLAWHVDKARFVADKGDYAEFAAAKYARLFLGTAEKDSRADKGVLRVDLAAAPDAPRRSRLLCIWGYSDYNRQGVADAYKRLEFRPFDAAWLEGMKPKWFDHWIGGGLEPEKKFLDARERFDAAAKQADDFWARQRSRLRIKTPDARFDNVVNHVAAQARVQFEYPGFMHGLGYAKYGKINHGYYGFEAAGMHDEVADSLHLIAGTQDVTGRQRYNMTTFAISDWHEDMDFYFIEQCWYHWRWTGDERFLRAIWPAARRALEHGLVVGDPDGDGLMTGYYEMWNCDGNNPGGYSALETAMGWAALRAGRDIAAKFDDRDYAMKHGGGQGHDPDYAPRYQRLLEQTGKQYLARLWSKEAGAWSSAEVDGAPRPRPHTCEQNYAIWRGLGTPMRNYMAMRYIRENHHHGDLIAGSTFESVNDWWPIQWSLHWVASGDACASFHSACAAGDIAGHWPVFKTIAESAYTTEGRPGGALWQGTGSNAMEMEPLFLAAVVDGLFGVKPWFGENLLVLRPSPLAAWDDLELNHLDARYRFHRDAERVLLEVTTPAPRRVRAELPVAGGVQGVLLDGSPVKFTLEQAVGAARVVIEAPAANEHRFEVRLAGERPKVEGPLHVVAGAKSSFSVRRAAVAAVHDPQEVAGEIRVAPATHAGSTVSFVCNRPGKLTVFLELQCGEVRWLHPLDLDVRQPWMIVERYRPPLSSGGPALLSPAIDVKQRTMTIELANGSDTELTGRARVAVAGRTIEQELSIPASGQASLTVALGEVWDRLSPGSVPVTVELAGRKETKEAVCWDIGRETSPATARMRPLDLRAGADAQMDKLFSPATQWRIDYTGAQHGVDRRYPLPLKDERGWVLMNSVMSVLEPYGTLPEQIVANGYLKLDKPGELPSLGAGVPMGAEPNRLLAVCCTQPYGQFPSRVTLNLPEPRRAEKLYLLTANLVKPLKCYYPGAEVVIHYADGSEQLHQMIPPYTMPSMIGNICPRAYALPIGKLTGNAGPVADTQAYLSLTDVVLDPSKPVASIELRCVATETLLGVAGATLLEAN
jgi:hypothetical protein